jgi:dihydropteroate synthase
MKSPRFPQPLVMPAATLDFAVRTYIMGILNVTPDSFSDGGRWSDLDKALTHARRMAENGADIIDVGGESTRPGAESVSARDEIDRVVPVIRRLASELDTPVSIDTYKAEVAQAAVQAGASLINDISAGTMDPTIFDVAAAAGVPIVVSHIQGTPRTMQRSPAYGDVVAEVTAFLASARDNAVKAGVDPAKVVVDPGIGFGKTLEHNLALLGQLETLADLGQPVLVGTSRKTFIGMITQAAGLGGQSPKEREEGTAASNALAIAHGAHIVRVHDVAAMARVSRVSDAIVRGHVVQQSGQEGVQAC